MVFGLILADEQVLRYAVVQAQAVSPLAVQCLHIGNQLLTLGKQLCRNVRIGLGRLDLPGVQHHIHLLQEVLLRSLVRVEFQAERCQPYFLKTRLHHRQGCHLLSHKQHPLALEQRVGYHVGNGLRLTRSGRAVQDERLAPTRLYHRLHLRRVDVQGYSKVLRLVLAVYATRINHVVVSILLVLLGNQRVNNGVLLQPCRVRVNVVPHDELVEREQAQHGFLQHVPLLLFGNGAAYVGENQLHVYPTLVFRQFLQRVEPDVETLLQQFGQRDVQYDVFVALAYDIVVACPSHHVHRQQQDGSKARLFALLRLVPLQHAECQEQAVGTVLLD